MKKLFIILLGGILAGCLKTSGPVISSDAFIDIKNDTLFDFENELIYKKCCQSYETFGRFSVSEDLKENIVKRIEPFSELFYYTKLKEDKLILLGYHDYYTDFVLVTFKDGKVKDAKTIATATGDGGDFYYKSAKFNNGVFLSDFKKGYRTFTQPDTIYYDMKGKSKIYTKGNNIQEDTLSVKKGFTEMAK